MSTLNTPNTEKNEDDTSRIIRRTNFYDLDADTQLAILIKMFKDAGYDLSNWYFDLQITKRQATIEELDQACKTALEIEDYEKAAKIRDIIKSKKDNDGKGETV